LEQERGGREARTDHEMAEWNRSMTRRNDTMPTRSLRSVRPNQTKYE